MTGVGLRDRVLALLRDAAVVYAGTGWQARFATAARDVDGPLRVALAGRVKAGKSTLLNALVGEAVAATDAGECTRIVTEYGYGPQDAVLGVPQSPAAGGDADPGPPLSLCREDGRVRVDLGGSPPEQFGRLVVTVPNQRLQGLTIIDTPGLASLSGELGAGTQRFLTEGTADAGAPDAVLYLLRHLHVTDLDFLQAFRDPAARRVPPVNALGVLARADELGGGRGDALELAARLAAGYGQEPALRPFVQTVVPVAGLLAEASVLLTAADFADLRALAGTPPAVTDALLLSADRFRVPRRSVPVGPDRRAELLVRLGLFGVRWSLEALRRGRVSDPEGLRTGLSEVSGLDGLRRVLAAQITGRREVLKADAALRLVRTAVTEQERPGARRLAAVAERLSLGAHDFQELRLLNDLRLGLVDAHDDLRRRAERLLGAAGGDLPDRLGLPADTPVAQQRDRLLVEHETWQRLAADPLTPPSLRRACEVVLRSLQGFHRGLAADPSPRAVRAAVPQRPGEP